MRGWSLEQSPLQIHMQAYSSHDLDVKRGSGNDSPDVLVARSAGGSMTGRLHAATQAHLKVLA